MSAGGSQLASSSKRQRTEERSQLEAAVREGLVSTPPLYRLRDVKKQKNQARCWNCCKVVWQIINTSDASIDERIGFVQCTVCETLLVYSDASGTNHLNKHYDNHEVVRRVTEATRVRVEPSENAVRSVQNAATQWIASDLLPFLLVDSPA